MNNFHLDYIYDIETFPNVFTLVAKHMITGRYYQFEISDHVSQFKELIKFLKYLSKNDCRMVGFNNQAFDYPIIHGIMNHQGDMTAANIYTHAKRIIDTSWDNRFSHIIWEPFIKQIDLLKIHHFDNVAKFTSLKILEFNMRSETIQDLPYTPGTYLTRDEIDLLIQYNKKDVDETEKFYCHSANAILLRESLSERFGKDFLNHNDTKIGSDYLIMKLEKESPGICYDERKKPKQTIRPFIDINSIIFPYVRFDNPEFNRILTWFKSQRIIETKGAFEDLNATINGFTFVFGTGGIHGSIESQTVVSDEEGVIIDVDVTSYYPNLGIRNKIFPEHLGHLFCDIYEEIYEERKKYKKGTPENAVFKLALNGTYGKSNSKYSPFYDSAYTMAITINGQLLLCMLAEMVMNIPGLKMIQINTDGLTVKCPENNLENLRSICKEWERITKLELEEARYSRMFIRDVNNYIAEYNSGKLKNKGAYFYNLGWHQNHSALIIPKAAEAALVHNVDVRSYICCHPNIYDFMLRTKVPRTSQLVYTDEKGHDHVLQNVTRYYISTDGYPLTKIMPPLKKNPTKFRRIGINVGRKTTECNDIQNARRDNIDFEYYIAETKKLVDPLRRKL